MAQFSAVLTAVLSRHDICDELLATGSFVLLRATQPIGAQTGVELPVRVSVGVSCTTMYIAMMRPGASLSDGYVHAIPRDNLLVTTRFALRGRVLILDSLQERLELRQRRRFDTQAAEVVTILR